MDSPTFVLELYYYNIGWAKCCLEHRWIMRYSQQQIQWAYPTISGRFVRRRQHSPRLSLLWIYLQRAVDINFSKGVPGDQWCTDNAQHIVGSRDSPRIHEEEFQWNLDYLRSQTSLQLHNEAYWCTINEWQMLQNVPRQPAKMTMHMK